MPLNPNLVADSLESVWRKQSPDEMIPARRIATSISQYIDSGQTAMMGIPSSSPGISQLSDELRKVWKDQKPDAVLVGLKEAKAIHNMVQATTTAGGKHGVGGFQSGSEALMAEQFSKLYRDKMNDERLIALKKARILDSYLKSCVFRGCGVGPDFIPDISGLT